MVLKFQLAANHVYHQGGVAIISRYVCKQLLKIAEDGWGLRLYVGDRDDVGASKIRGFDNDDKVVVSSMREFIDDNELHDDGARQQQTAAQVHICLVRRHPIFIYSPTSTATALTRFCLHPLRRLFDANPLLVSFHDTR